MSKKTYTIRGAIFLFLISALTLTSCAAPKSSGAFAYHAAEVEFDERVLADAAPAARSAVSPAGGGDSDAPRHNRMVAHTVSLSVSVDDPAEAAITLREHVEKNGGFVVSEHGRTTTHFRDVNIVTRIPSQNMNAFIENVSALGEIFSRNVTGQDITDQYRDDVIRLENLNRLRERYLAMLEKAETVNDMLAIEKELERINTEIDRFTGRINFAKERVALANISVRLVTEKEREHKKTRPGPLGWVFVGLYHGIKWFFVW